MLEYQNLFSRVQIRHAPHQGLPIDETFGQRYGKGGFSYWLGKFGDAQIGPIYLGFWGITSIFFGFVAIEIIGLNFFVQVDWSPVEFVRQLPWLTLEPPPPEYGLSFPPMNEGGWWLNEVKPQSSSSGASSYRTLRRRR